MTEVTVTDASGETLAMLDFDGFKMSFYGQTADHIRDVYYNLPNFRFRDEDIFLASYPKSGCTWTFEIMSMLLSGHPKGLSYEKGATMLDAKTEANMDSIPSPRIVNSHLPFDKLPPDLLQKKMKTVYVIRNYKDITVSMYNFMRGLKHYNYNGKWENWLQLHLAGKLTFATYFSYVRQWEDVIKNARLPLHVVYYEDLKSDTLSEIRRLAKFLGLSLEEHVLEEISVSCQFDVMKKKYSNEEMDTLRFKQGAGFFRKGEAGDWKNWYTVAQNDIVNELIRTNVDDYKTSIHFGLKYKW